MKVFRPLIMVLLAALAPAVYAGDSLDFSKRAAQASYRIKKLKDDDPEKPRTIYLGIGTGINNSSGIIGPSLEVGLFNKISVFAAGGLGTWGFKATGGMRYYLSFPRKVAFGLSYSYCGGADHATPKLNVVDSVSGTDVQKQVTMRLKPASTLNLTFLYYWRLGKHHRFNIEAGYAIPLQGVAYEVKSNVVLSQSSKDALRILQPGGIIIAAAFTFGLH